MQAASVRIEQVDAFTSGVRLMIVKVEVEPGTQWAGLAKFP